LKSDITILTVSWFSADLILSVIACLTEKAETPSNLNFLIIDNSNGRDLELNNLNFKGVQWEIIPNNPDPLKSLYAHASGLNLGISLIETEYVMIIDPDIHFFKQNWDTFFKQELNTHNLDFAGTAYPSWWLGTYHNFPSPICLFAKRDALQKLNANWLPPKISLLASAINLIKRQILRGGFLFNRRNLLKYRVLRKFAGCLEQKIKICSLDTGVQIANEAKNNKVKSIIFNAIYPEDLPTSADNSNALHALASHFELYMYDSEIILTHQYGSQNFLLKTAKGSDTAYWRELIEDCEA
jgi:hypothetical protein